MNPIPVLLALAAVAISAPLSATVPSITLGGVSGTWQLNNNLNETNAGSALIAVGTTPAYAAVTIGGKSDTALNLPALPSSASITLPNAVGGNGGSAIGRTNAWTIVMDLKMAGQGTDAGLLQTDPANTDDAEAHIMGGPGVQYEYYHPGSLSALPDFDALVPVATGTAATFDLSPRLQDDFFAFRFRGRIRIATAGDYTFHTSSDDGSQLFINDQLVVDNDGIHSLATQSGIITLTEGTHDIEVTFFESTGQEVLTVEYEGPGVARQVISGSVLTQGDAGAIRLGPDLIADPASIQLNKWHRLAITSEISGADLLLKAYVDGVQTALNGSPAAVTKPLDGDWSLPALVSLFTDDTTQTQPLLIHSLSYWGGPLSSAQVAALGGPVVPGLPDLYVRNTNNGGAESLRARIAAVRNGGLVSFELGISGQIIPVGSGGPLTINKALVIDASHLSAQPSIDGESSFRAFNIDSAANVSLRNLKLIRGSATTAGGFGGAIRNYGILELVRCSISGSIANVNGGAIMNEGSATLTVVDSVLFNNSSGAGGAISNAGVATLLRSTIHGNTAGTAGGIEAINTTMMTNCTVTGNASTNGGGGGLSTFGSLTLISCTVTGNTANDPFAFESRAGGGVLLDFLVTLTIDNCIVAGNSSNLASQDNIGGTENGEVISLGANLTDGDPHLESLGDYGGLTLTMPPKSTSRAVAVGVPTVNTPTTDQRGLPRIDNVLDLGAVETAFEAALLPFEAWANANIPAGQDRSFTGDPEGDGITNGREYAFRMNPVGWDPLLQPRSAPTPATGLNRHLQIVLPYSSSAADLVYILLETATLQTFYEVWRYTVSTGTETITDPNLQTTIDTGAQTITITDPAPNSFTTFWKVGVQLAP